MAIIELFSKRQKKLQGDIPDVYLYDVIPQNLRAQIVHIWSDTLAEPFENRARQTCPSYEEIISILCREYGLFSLPGTNEYDNEKENLIRFFISESKIEILIDVIELSLKFIDTFTRNYSYLGKHNGSSIATEAINELNYRFKEHGVGYQFINGEIIRIDSELIHSEVVKPVLRLLNQKQYEGSQQEFLKAHEHYRKGNSKEALNECLKSFESLMKAICDKRGWKYENSATAKKLIQICLENDLIPKFWQTQYSSLSSLLESSIPTGRNKLSGHGQGMTTTTVPDHLVAYMLHMTASALVFLGEAETKLP